MLGNCLTAACVCVLPSSVCVCVCVSVVFVLCSLRWIASRVLVAVLLVVRSLCLIV
jgi:hypothetical protein